MMVIREKITFIHQSISQKYGSIDNNFIKIESLMQSGNREMAVPEEVLSDLMMAQSNNLEFYLQESA